MLTIYNEAEYFTYTIDPHSGVLAHSLTNPTNAIQTLSYLTNLH